jgi:hypothetical protein
MCLYEKNTSQLRKVGQQLSKMVIDKNFFFFKQSAIYVYPFFFAD